MKNKLLQGIALITEMNRRVDVLVEARTVKCADWSHALANAYLDGAIAALKDETTRIKAGK